MDRCIVLVDAGYLLGAAATLLTGDAARSRLSVDHAGLIQQIRDRAQTETGQPLLRMYWFDAAPDRVPQPEHRRLRVTPRVTVRLGTLTRADGRFQQKGVDAAMHAQLIELARHKAASDIVLITGDGDLLPGMMAAKEHGAAMHLWAVQAADGAYNQSEDLVAEADERHLLDRTWLTRAITAAELTPMDVPAQPASERSAPIGTSGVSQGPLPTSARTPTPGDLARPTPAVALRWSSDSGWVDPGDSFPLLELLTTPQQVWVDREQDLEVTGEPHEVGRTFAARWAQRLPHDQAVDLLARLDQARPRIPRSLDSELLRYAARFGTIGEGNEALDISDNHRVRLRAGFWSGIEQSTAALSAPTP